jgi:hypothetical protein
LHGAHALEAVGNHCHPDSRPAAQDTHWHPTFRDFTGGSRPEIGIVDGLFVEWSFVNHSDAEVHQMFLDRLFESVSRVV